MSSAVFRKWYVEVWTMGVVSESATLGRPERSPPWTAAVASLGAPLLLEDSGASTSLAAVPQTSGGGRMQLAR
ncbi:hypothetical protein TSOC_002500 [Tetrabaena socialis]|uniref:Uncharacterized protein n=1 Tax=Tetrabaena socialis TaxID=47790 RepID=A0A2J8ADW1_9CHLO|nr:hypothetical protein TSOC_002500 [Tetrabaena socialis]|eukprot:PNH10703.1 hypothetical protein TSOC_002500 [Tetrabaena socialis]